jgi:lipopolysaccharide heptosyltransferase II|uniref:Glycosyl transferase family 9 n=2 Tax=Ralstonia pickettii TaxID=329 RepID=C6BLV7_RALP1
MSVAGIPDRRAVWANASRILCVRPDNLGDVVMTTPAFHALKAAARADGARRHLTLLTSRAGATAVPHLSDIDDVIACDVPWAKHANAADADQTGALVDTLGQGAFDAAVIFTVHTQNPLPAAMLCFLAGIPLRLAHCRENPYALLTDWIADADARIAATAPGDVRHEVRRQLDLVAQVTAVPPHLPHRLRFTVRPADRDTVRTKLSARGIRHDAPWIVLHPGATAASRRYPPDRFARIARALAARYGCPVLVTGAPAEAELVQQVCRPGLVAGQPVLDLAGALTLGELAALIEGAALLVSNNSGPVHLAAATLTPVVDLYALTNPQHTPWAVPHAVLSHQVPCRYCYRSVCPLGHQACLTGVAEDDVIAAAQGLWQPTRVAQALWPQRASPAPSATGAMTPVA